MDDGIVVEYSETISFGNHCNVRVGMKAAGLTFTEIVAKVRERIDETLMDNDESPMYYNGPLFFAVKCPARLCRTVAVIPVQSLVLRQTHYYAASCQLPLDRAIAKAREIANKDALNVLVAENGDDLNRIVALSRDCQYVTEMEEKDAIPF